MMMREKISLAIILMCILGITIILQLRVKDIEEINDLQNERINILSETNQIMFDYCTLKSVECQEEENPIITEEILNRETINLNAGEHAKLAESIAKCESGYKNVRGKIDPRDRGVFQINSHWNPDVTDECAFDVVCSTRWFVRQIEAGNIWKWDNSKHCWGGNV